MAEFGAYIYTNLATVPSVYVRAAQEKKAAEAAGTGERARPQAKAPPALRRRAQSASRAASKKDRDKKDKSLRSRLRGHARAQSGSSASGSSLEGGIHRVSSSPVRATSTESDIPPPPRLLETHWYSEEGEQQGLEGAHGDTPSISRGHGFSAAGGTLDDVSHYPHFHNGQAHGLDEPGPHSQRRATEVSQLPGKKQPHQAHPSPGDRRRDRGHSSAGLVSGHNSSTNNTRPDSSSGKAAQSPRGRATLDRFHVPRLPFSLASASSSTTPLPTPTPTADRTPSTPTQAQVQVQAQSSPPFPMDSASFIGAVSMWDQPKIPIQYRSPDSGSNNNRSKTAQATSSSAHQDRSTIHSLLHSNSRLDPSAISLSQLTEHIGAASVAAHAAMASPYTAKNASNPSIDASVTGTGRGSNSTSLSRITPTSTRPFTLRSGRTYLADPSIPYPLPVDLSELHRQSLRTLLQIQVFGAPICSSVFATRAPTKVLEVGCGAGFWSMMCHRYFSSRGQSNISFVGMDVAPLAPSGSSSDAGGAGAGGGKPDRDMRWKFVQHDMRYPPWPFQDGEFDLIMAKEVFIGITGPMQQMVMDEYMRILRPGGVLEIWEADHQIRMLRPHAPATKKKPAPDASKAAPPRRTASKAAKDGSSSSESSSDEEDGDDDEEDSESSSSSSDDEASTASSLGAYIMTANTPLSAPLNSYLVEYNTWINRALLARDLSPVPCTILGPLLLQESDELTDVRSRRLAIPLAEVRWEREGVGGVVTKDGKSYIDSGRARRQAEAAAAAAGGAAGKGKASSGGSKRLTAGQAAVRRTAMLTVVQLVQSLEPLLRETSGKSQDEWDGWMGKMMNDLMRDNGAGCGECLEVGAWWARKKGGTR